MIAALITLTWIAANPLAKATLASGDPVVAAAGDIACDPADPHFNGGLGTGSGKNDVCRQEYVSNLLVNGNYSAVLSLGDNQYYCGSLAAYDTSYDLSWGRLKSITYPVPGNHEFLTHGGSSPSTGCDSSNTGGAGYYNYFGSAAGSPGAGYYSYNIGAWHLIALNSNCGDAGGCNTSSPQGKWLTADLAAHSNQCILAYWHIPLFSSGGRANGNSQTFWNLLYAAHADLVLVGHDHIYERFAPQTPAGVADPVNGLTQITVGTGGANHTSIATIAANSVVRDTTSFGILAVTLHQSSFDWSFLPVDGTFTDSGSQQCHNAGSGSSASASSSLSPSASASSSSSASASTSASPSASPSASTSPTPTPIVGGTSTFSPAADSYVDSSKASTNYGTSKSLRVDGSPVVDSYLRFNVTGLPGPVISATLQVYANSSQSTGYTAYSVSDNTWGETTIDYANAPPFGAQLGSSGKVTSGTWTSVDVTSAIAGSGTYSFGLLTTNSTALSMSSREGTNPPQLVITTAAAAPTLSASPSDSPSASPSDSPSASPSDSPSASPSDSPSASPSDSPSASPSDSPSASPSDSPSASPSDSPSASPSDSPSASPSDSPSASPSDSPSASPSVSPSVTPTASPTPTPAPVTTTVTPAADSYVDSSNTTATHGTQTTIRIDGSPTVNSYIRFNVSGLSGSVTSAILRVYANSSQSTGYDAYQVADNTWSESTLDWSNAPPFGSKLGSSGKITGGTWTSVDVTPYITGNGTYSFGLSTTNSTAVSLSSREGANPPQLVITTSTAAAIVPPPPPQGGEPPATLLALLLLVPLMAPSVLILGRAGGRSLQPGILPSRGVLALSLARKLGIVRTMA